MEEEVLKLSINLGMYRWVIDKIEVGEMHRGQILECLWIRTRGFETENNQSIKSYISVSQSVVLWARNTSVT